MIRVLGEAPEAIKQTTCTNCATRLEYTQSDVQIQNNGRDISGGPDGHEYIKCPKCGNKIITKAW